jgi:hypothetical protein
MKRPLCKHIHRKFQRDKQVDLSVKLDPNMVARRPCIIIMGNKEERQIPIINASVIDDEFEGKRESCT